MENTTDHMEMIDEFIVPAKSGKAFDIRDGQRFRIGVPEGVQVCDATLVNPDNPEDHYSGSMTVSLNEVKGIGTMWDVKELYSRGPDVSHLATITEDRIRFHSPWYDVGCTRYKHKIRDNLVDYPNCSQNLVSALNEHGIPVTKAPGILNLGMQVGIKESGETYYKRPEYTKGDFVEFEAEMDLVVGVSACPNHTHIINMYEPKSLKVEIFE